MPDAPAYESRASSITKFLLIAAVTFAVASLLDRWAYEHLADMRVYERDWGRLLRIIGYLPLWVLAAAALVLHDGGVAASARWRRGGLLLGSAALGGLAAEVLKLLLRRERPRVTGGDYVFRPFTQDPLHSGGLGLPSSHTLVAFAGAAMLARLFPRAAPVWYLVAVGCALTRVMSQSHFLSDTVLAAFVGFAVAALLWRRWGIHGAPPRAEGVRGG